MKPIIFLDFDGVVNTFYWTRLPSGEWKNSISTDSIVNNLQAIGWLNELYKEIPYDIVVTSTWRIGPTTEELQRILWNSGFNKDIKVIGKTPILHQQRGLEIQQWIEDNGFHGKFIILDDDSDMGELLPLLVRCDCYIGFGLHEFNKSRRLLS